MPGVVVERIRLGFDNALARLVRAENEVTLHLELGHLLEQHYRLGEYCAEQWGLKGPQNRASFDARVRPVVPGAVGALWVRIFDTHDSAEVATLKDIYPSVYGVNYGELVWTSVVGLPNYRPDVHERHEDYSEHLQGRPVLTSLPPAFEGLAALL